MKYTVTGKSSIQSNQNAVIAPGSVVEEGDLFPSTFASYIKSGKLIPVGTPIPAAPPITNAPPHMVGVAVATGNLTPLRTPVPLAPKNIKLPPGSPDFTDANANPDSLLPKNENSPWRFSVKELESKDLPALNAMIIERAPNQPAFDDRAEAVAFLTMDGPKT